MNNTDCNKEQIKARTKCYRDLEKGQTTNNLAHPSVRPPKHINAFFALFQCFNLQYFDCFVPFAPNEVVSSFERKDLSSILTSG